MKNRFFAILFFSLFFSTNAFAHGTAEEHQTEWGISVYFLIGTFVLFVLFLILHYREKRQQVAQWVKGFKWLWILSLLGVVISGAMTLWGNGLKTESAVELYHVHGLGYTTDGKTILIPAHTGIAAYAEGHWSFSPGDKNDYMGFSAVDDGFYSSGHPSPGSSLKNPIGLVKSSDAGKTITKLALEGEADFHGMSVGYFTHHIYVFNSVPNSKMNTSGLYYSKNEGKTWIKSSINGLEGQPVALSAHPKKEGVVAVGTQKGTYISKDFGNTFEKIGPDLQVTSLYYTNEGALFIGGLGQEPSLQIIDIETKSAKAIPIPNLAGDPIDFTAQNPVNPKEVVFSTDKKEVYLTHDEGTTWIKIAEQGKTISAIN